MTHTKRLVIDQMKMRYDGLFDASELYRIIDGWFYEKHWDKKELVNTELVRPTGKQLNIVMHPWKSISDYHKLWLHIRINILDLQQVEVELDGVKTRLQQGKFFLVLDGFVYSDRHSNWSQRPLHWFIQMLAELYFFRPHYAKAEAWLRSDVEDIMNKLKNYFNLYQKYERGVIIPFMRA